MQHNQAYKGLAHGMEVHVDVKEEEGKEMKGGASEGEGSYGFLSVLPETPLQIPFCRW
jgi:hypothetical protein